MVTPELVDYIKTQLTKGYAADFIKQTLITKNWQQTDIDQAFLLINQSRKKKRGLLKTVLWSMAGILTVVFVLLTLLDKITAPAFAAISVCFQTATRQREVTLEEVQHMDYAERTQKFCIEETSQVNELITCINNAERLNSFAGASINLFSPPLRKMRPIVEKHNTNCPDSPVSIP